MPVASRAPSCNCLALRQAARKVTQFYDGFLAPHGLRTTQFSILVHLRRSGPCGTPWGIQALAERLVMDRTTLGRNLRPLQRDGLVAIGPGVADRRARVLSITAKGAAVVEAATPAWEEAQRRFEQGYGPQPAADLRAALAELSRREF